MRRTKPKLPNSLTQHLSDPKVVAFRPRDRRRSRNRLFNLTQKIAISVVTFVVIVLAGGHLLRAW